MIQLSLTSPLFTNWSPQYMRLYLPDTQPGQALALTIGNADTPFQYTGAKTAKGAEILVKLGFAKNETKELILQETGAESQICVSQRCKIPLDEQTVIGVPGCELMVDMQSPFAGFAGSAMTSSIHCDSVFEGAGLVQINDGPLFTDYELEYRYEENRRYTLNFRCYKLDSYIEVTETFSLGMNAELVWTLNPNKRFTHIISRDSFEGESQPTVEPLGEAHPRDLLCRLQMPVLTEYFIPNNRGWFAFYDQRNKSNEMIGILGLYGAKWEEPVANMPEIFDRHGAVEWHASLVSGKRHWLLYAGPLETEYRVQSSEGGSSDRSDQSNLTDQAGHRFVFHRLHAEFNALRLDEHLDLSGDEGFDESCKQAPGVFAGGDYHAAARQRLQEYPCLQQVLPPPDAWLQANGSMHLASYSYLLEPTSDHAEELYQHLLIRFEKWVRQFQGYRTNENDYMKNVIGFSRYLRGMLMAYEQLRRDNALTNEQVSKLNAYFAFAARRITDEGRWPHSRTWKHPDHPESSRDFYTYGGEHKPDRLVWTNCLPNFQSDPMCALAHLSGIFKDHPDAGFWLRFALEDIDRQLDAYCGKSGAWQESINYALYTLSYFIITFKVVKERWGIDYFNDERVRRFVDWLCRFFGPYDKRFDAYTWPAIGNAVLPQNQAEYLLCFANELADDDPLRAECLSVWDKTAMHCRPGEHYPVVMAAMAPVGEEARSQKSEVRRLHSEIMDEVGVALRDRYGKKDESYLFQKIGFAKDHYEADETAFNWYAKGTPLCMDYGTYTSDVAVGGAHNVVEIPDEDNIRRGYIADHLFGDIVDYTRCEVPVTLKLLWGKVRTFAEVDNKDGKIDRTKTLYFYIGDKNPVGPKVWKVRQMLYVKPDYTVMFDRVYGCVQHRYNLHFTGTDIKRATESITAKGRFDLDLHVHVQHPLEFKIETGEIVPNLHSGCGGDEQRKKHSQNYFRLYNEDDGIYRTLIFAQERGRELQIKNIGKYGIKVITPEYTDYVFLHNDFINEITDEVSFRGRAGWIRKTSDGNIFASIPDGSAISAFNRSFEGFGPWSTDCKTGETITIHNDPPRKVNIRHEE